MPGKVPVTIKLASCLLAGTLTCAAAAQNPGTPLNSDALNLLLEQNRQMREELQALRAMVEEQGFELRRLQRDSLNRYSNMDERLSALESTAVSASRSGGTALSTGNPGNTPATSTAVPGNPPGVNSADPGSRPAGNTGAANNSGVASAPGGGDRSARNSNAGGDRVSGRSTLQPAVLSEQQLYQMAYDSVINSNFERSIAEFDQYLSVYPEGRFVTNAHYWKGQAYLYLNRYDEARESYEIILDGYSDAAKVPDAMYGLALAYQGLGNVTRARQLLNEIKRRFPNTGVANLADTRLLTLD